MHFLWGRGVGKAGVSSTDNNAEERKGSAK